MHDAVSAGQRLCSSRVGWATYCEKNGCTPTSYDVDDQQSSAKRTFIICIYSNVTSCQHWMEGAVAEHKVSHDMNSSPAELINHVCDTKR